MLNEVETTLLSRRAIVANDLAAVAALLDTAQEHLPAQISTSSGWYNLSVVAQLARANCSPVLSLARQSALHSSDRASNLYEEALRDMVLVESGDSLELIEFYLNNQDRVGYFVAKRASHLAAEVGDIRIMRMCLNRLSSFDNIDSLNGSPHINWLIAKALLDRALGKPIDREGLCKKIRATRYLWKSYCREINAVLGPHDSEVCADCVKQMSGIPQYGE